MSALRYPRAIFHSKIKYFTCRRPIN